MLALSLLLTLSFAFSATLHLLVRNTRLKPLSTTLSLLQPFLIPALLLLTLNLYSTDSVTTSSHSLKSKLLHSSPSPTTPHFASNSPLLESTLEQAPQIWASILRTLSPIFVILEGLCTLLCIQRVSRFTLTRIENSKSPDFMKLFILVLASAVYVGNFWFLFEVRPRLSLSST